MEETKLVVTEKLESENRDEKKWSILGKIWTTRNLIQGTKSIFLVNWFPHLNALNCDPDERTEACRYRKKLVPQPKGIKPNSFFVFWTISVLMEGFKKNCIRIKLWYWLKKRSLNFLRNMSPIIEMKLNFNFFRCFQKLTIFRLVKIFTWQNNHFAANWLFLILTLMGEPRPAVTVQIEIKYRIQSISFAPSGAFDLSNFWCNDKKHWFLKWIFLSKCFVSIEISLKNQSNSYGRAWFR